MSTPYLGEIRMFAGNFAIDGWAFCNGQSLSINENSALFALLGTTYGGDGVQTFALPDLRSRVPIHQGQGSGLSPYVLGQASGTENVTLTTSNMPSHSHTLNATSAAATSQTIASSELPANTTSPLGVDFYVSTAGSPAPTFGTLDPVTIGPQGGSQPHANVMPYLTINFIIALQGIFPSPN